MELLLGAALLGYGYASSASKMTDENNETVNENHVQKYRHSTNRRVGGVRPRTDDGVAYAFDDFSSRRSVYDIPKFVTPNAPDPGWQRHVFDEGVDVDRFRTNFSENLQHHTSQSWDTWDSAMAYRNPNESFRGNFSEIGTVRTSIPRPYVRQPFAVKQ